MFLVSFTPFPGSTLEPERSRVRHSQPVHTRLTQCNTADSLPTRRYFETTVLLAAGIALSLDRVCSNQFSNNHHSRTHELILHYSASPSSAAACRRSTIEHRSGASKLDFAGTDLDARRERRGQGEQQARIHRDRRGIRQPAKAHDFRQRVSDLRFVGDFARRPRRQSWRSVGRRQPSQQADASPPTFRLSP